jgi:hypothetical protein
MRFHHTIIRIIFLQHWEQFKNEWSSAKENLPLMSFIKGTANLVGVLFMAEMKPPHENMRWLVTG